MKKLALALVLASAAAIAVVLVTASSAAEPVPTTVREVLASTRVASPPGHTLVLVKVTAMPGALLAKHRHPGTQSVSIVSGSVSYTVYKGIARIYHGPADAAAKPVRVITAGHSGAIRAGDWFTETPSLVHSAKVTSSGPFVVVIAGLLKTGEPLAIPVR
jgi:quercetin dioxygenase-like cupin family protein